MRLLTAGRQQWLVRVLPWWGLVGVGIAAVAVGAVLIGQPFRSLTALVWLTAAALLVTGVGELATAVRSPRPWLALLGGMVLVVTSVVVVAWPGITVLTLAIVAGVALVVRGVARIAEALLDAPDERWIVGLGGLTGLLSGVLALSWPSVTVLVLAVVFGVGTVVIGVRQIDVGWRLRGDPTGAGARSRRRWPRWVRGAGALVAFAAAAALTVGSVAVHRAQPDDPGPFYTPPSPLPDGPPGTIIRREVLEGFQPGATTHRVLYLSTGYDGRPTAVSGLVVIPDAPPPPGGRKVLAYTHGTVGVASRCGPSVQGDHWAAFMRQEGLGAFVEAGYLVAASDYQGLGTRGPHPYLVGASEGMNELDAIRAARSLPGAQASADVGVWGHSQGGHAALFTAQLAPAYAPELHLVGVAAGAPAPDLVAMFKDNLDSPVGKILIAMALQSWTEVYDAASLSQIVTPAARPAVRAVARNCLFSAAQIIASAPSSAALGLTFLSTPPWETEPWRSIVAANDPGQTRLGLPVLLTQGAADPLIAPAFTAALAERMCAQGDDVELRLLDGAGHIDGGPAAVPVVTAWLAERFAGQPLAAAGCS